MCNTVSGAGSILGLRMSSLPIFNVGPTVCAREKCAGGPRPSRRLCSLVGVTSGYIKSREMRGERVHTLTPHMAVEIGRVVDVMMAM